MSSTILINRYLVLIEMNPRPLKALVLIRGLNKESEFIAMNESVARITLSATDYEDRCLDIETSDPDELPPLLGGT